MQVIRRDDCNQTKGGRYNLNDVYVYERGIEPELEDLTDFSGGICWGYDVQQHYYYGKHDMRQGT